MSKPIIFTYLATDRATPEHMRAVASLDREGPGRHWMCAGSTPEEAEAKLRAFWEAHEGPNKTKARAARKTAECDLPDPDSDWI